MTRYGPPTRCPVCGRGVPVTLAGTLRKHLAAAGRREKCDGSERRPATEAETAPVAAGWDRLTAAERFNAAGYWQTADALYNDWTSMRDGRAATPDDLDRTRAAWQRAWDTAKELAPMGQYEGTEGES